MRFSGIIAGGDINKEENIVTTNNRLEKYCKGNEFFFIDNSNIDASCLNKSKLHLNRKGTSYLANNFRKQISNIKWNIYDSIKRKKALECLCISPMFMPNWHSDVVTTLWQRRGCRYHNFVASSKMRVVATSVSNVVTTSLYDVAKTLPQCCYNVATTLTNGCVGAF